MQKVYHLDSPREKYHSDGIVVGCFDNRFEVVCRKLVKRIGVSQPDPIRIAGGAKALVSPDEEFHRTFVLQQIQKSIRLHSTELVILTLHSDCGAYGGLARFNGDPDAEATHFENELKTASSWLTTTIPGLRVVSYYLNFEGAWIVD